MNSIDINDFYSKYELIGSNDLYEAIQPQRCRFCGELSQEFFQHKSHLIPELLGANNYIATDECDKCNAYFSKYESHLAIFARPYLVMTNVKTKDKVPEFQSRSNQNDHKRTTVKVDKITGQRQIIANQDDVVFDLKNETYQITFRNPSFSPLNLYKALCKITLGMMPLKLIAENSELFKWIIGQDVLYEIPHGFQTKLLSKYYKIPEVMLYQSRNTVSEGKEYPEFIGIVCFANTIIQFYLPITKRFSETHSNKNDLELTIYPGFSMDEELLNSGEVNLVHMNLAIEEKMLYDEKFTLKSRNTF